MKLNGAQILLASLIKENVDTVFGYPGGAVLTLYDHLKKYPQIRHILTRHEQGAAFAADGYARASGKTGVCFATSGPGATNLVTGLADAYMDSIPLVAITGQVPLEFLGKDAFQEIDITGVTLPITKHNYLADNIKDLARIIKEAFHIAGKGRPGPVLIDIPKDVFVQKTEFKYPEKVNLPGFKPPQAGDLQQIKLALELIKKSKKPLILAGHGVLLSHADRELTEFVNKSGIPVVNTLLGLGSLPENHPLCLGMLGMHGHAHANYATHHTDLIINFGCRFDDRITGRLDQFAPDAKIIHVDIDPVEIGKNVPVDVPIIGNCQNVLKALIPKITQKNLKNWLLEIEDYRDNMEVYANQILGQKRRTNRPQAHDIIQAISAVTDEDSIIATDVGQNQMFTAQHYQFTHPHTILSSGGLGSMGFSLPAAIGAQIAKPQKTVWSICGDGGFQMNIQELMTVTQEKLPLKIALLNNQFLGMVRQWQEMFYKKNYAFTPMLSPDYELICKAYGIKYLKIQKRTDIKKIFTQAQNSKQAILVECLIEPEENVYPMVPAGKSLADTIIAE